MNRSSLGLAAFPLFTFALTPLSPRLPDRVAGLLGRAPVLALVVGLWRLRAFRRLHRDEKGDESVPSPMPESTD